MLANQSKPTLARFIIIAGIFFSVICVVSPVSAQLSITPTVQPTSAPIKDEQKPSDSYTIIDTTSVTVTDEQSTITTTDDTHINAQTFSDEPIATPLPSITPSSMKTATTSGGKVQTFTLPKLSITPTLAKKHKHQTFQVPNMWQWFTGIFHK